MDRNSTLIIGWGSDLRGDDAAGRLVARRIEAARWPAVHVIDTHLLMPELALSISEHDRVIFVDVYPAAAGAADLTCHEILPTAVTAHLSGHHVTPEYLLNFAVAYYQARPRAWLIGIPARQFDIGERLSPETESGMAAAIDCIRSLVETGEPNTDCSCPAQQPEGVPS